MDEPLGSYVPPDDLPDVPFTPPEPEPDNRKAMKRIEIGKENLDLETVMNQRVMC